MDEHFEAPVYPELLDAQRNNLLGFQQPFNFANAFGLDPMPPLPEVDDPVGARFEPGYSAAPPLMVNQGPVFEFCTPNQQGIVRPSKVVAPLEDLALPPPVFNSTPINTPGAPGSDSPFETPPFFVEDPAAAEAPLAFPTLPAAVREGTQMQNKHMSTPSPAVPQTPKQRMGTPRVIEGSPSIAPKDITPKDIPTQLPKFQISVELQCDLAGGPHRGNRRCKTHHTEKEVDELIRRLYGEAEDRAERRKIEVRDFLKQDLHDKQATMDSRSRSLQRSRREAKVSRVKSEEYSRALKDIIRYLIVNTDTRRPDQCVCKKACGKRKTPPT